MNIYAFQDCKTVIKPKMTFFMFAKRIYEVNKHLIIMDRNDIKFWNLE
jgi:hypothetical protein